jgi:hypothetical protein
MSALDVIGYAHTETSGSVTHVAIEPTYEQTTGTAANTDLLINRTETHVGSGTQLLADFQVGGTSKASIDHNGTINADAFVGDGSGLTNLASNSDIAYLQTEIDAIDASGYITSADLTSLVFGSGNTYTGANSFAPSLSAASGTTVGCGLSPTYNNSGTAADIDLLVNRTNTAVGSGSHKFLSLQVSSSEKVSINTNGDLTCTSVTGDGSGLTSLNASNISSGTLSSSLVDFNPLSIYPAGTDSYTVTGTLSQVTIDSTSIALTINAPGTYLILTRYVRSISASDPYLLLLRLRRTNNTAGYINNETILSDGLSAATGSPGYDMSETLAPVIYTTTNSNDSISLFAGTDAGESGVAIKEASIVAIRIG